VRVRAHGRVCECILVQGVDQFGLSGQLMCM